MAKKKLTKKDPNQELAAWLELQKRAKRPKEVPRISASLHRLQAERRRSLLRRLGLILVVSLLAIGGLLYFISPKSNLTQVRVSGAEELNSAQIVRSAGFSAQDKVLLILTHQSKYINRLKKAFPELAQVKLSVNHFNHLNVTLTERPVIGYIKEPTGYRKILDNGKVGSQIIDETEIDKAKPFFIGYSRQAALRTDLKVYAQLPKDIHDEVRILSGETQRPSQIILVMKDNNVVIGNTATLVHKMKYYNKIKSQLQQPSVVDLEVGAFTRPLTPIEKKQFEINS